MPTIKRTLQVNYSAEQMYHLVNNVYDYPQFLPDCMATQIMHISPVTQTAMIEITKFGFTQRFTTKNKMIPHRNINIYLLSGPFRYLYGEWQFLPLHAGGCQITFMLTFEFNNPLISLAFNKTFCGIMINQIEAFVQRAESIYGT